MRRTPLDEQISQRSFLPTVPASLSSRAPQVWGAKCRLAFSPTCPSAGAPDSPQASGYPAAALPHPGFPKLPDEYSSTSQPNNHRRGCLERAPHACDCPRSGLCVLRTAPGPGGWLAPTESSPAQNGTVSLEPRPPARSNSPCPSPAEYDSTPSSFQEQ